MIENLMCDRCDHMTVCDKRKVIMKFDENAKKDLFVDIKMISCQDYVESEE